MKGYDEDTLDIAVHRCFEYSVNQSASYSLQETPQLPRPVNVPSTFRYRIEILAKLGRHRTSQCMGGMVATALIFLTQSMPITTHAAHIFAMHACVAYTPEKEEEKLPKLQLCGCFTCEPKLRR